MASTNRVQIVLPPDERQLADVLAAHLGGVGRSAAIRYALRWAVRALNLRGTTPVPAPKKGKREA